MQALQVTKEIRINLKEIRINLLEIRTFLLGTGRQNTVFKNMYSAGVPAEFLS